jgi:hypothetical protein
VPPMKRIPQLPIEQIRRLPAGTVLYCIVVEQIKDGRRICCSRFRLSVYWHNQLWSVPVSQLEGFGIFDDHDKITLAADRIDVLVSDLGKELHNDPGWFELLYT